MAEIQPLTAVHYNVPEIGDLADLVAPPYDVIDAAQRAALVARSPYNVVELDLPQGEDRYEKAAAKLFEWLEEGVLVRDEIPAIWALVQDYTGPDGREMTRRGFLCRVRIEPYGAGRVRPHERTHPGPKQDRLELMRATGANLSPIFALYSDPVGTGWEAIADADPMPWGEVLDADGTRNRVWRVTDPAAISGVKRAVRRSELLIADGHHRYETARTFGDEVGGDGWHRYVLACLVAMEDPGLTVFPTHRLVRDLTSAQHEALATAIKRDWEIEEISRDELVPANAEDGVVRIGYMDSHFKRPFRLTLRDQAIADAALGDHAEPYRRLDTAVTEALLLKGALGLTDEHIDHLDGFGYARDAAQAIAELESGAWDAAFFMGPTPVETVRAVARAGESMPPKSTYFFPKIPTGIVFNPLAE